MTCGSTKPSVSVGNSSHAHDVGALYLAQLIQMALRDGPDGLSPESPSRSTRGSRRSVRAGRRRQLRRRRHPRCSQGGSRSRESDASQIGPETRPRRRARRAHRRARCCLEVPRGADSRARARPARVRMPFGDGAQLARGTTRRDRLRVHRAKPRPLPLAVVLGLVLRGDCMAALRPKSSPSRARELARRREP